MKNILVPTDFSKHAEFALKAAAILAKRQKARVVIVHMLELSPQITALPEVVFQEETAFMRAIANKELALLRNRTYLEGLSTVTDIVGSRIGDAIRQITARYKIDLIVMGSHGSGDFTETILGSNTTKVIRLVDVPVLVLKEDPGNLDIAKILFASDFKTPDAAAFGKVCEFAKLFDAQISTVLINVPGKDFISTDEARERIAAFWMAAATEMEVSIYNEYTVERGILQYAHKIGAGLIAMGTHSRTALTYVLLGSLSSEIAQRARLPVLAIGGLT